MLNSQRIAVYLLFTNNVKNIYFKITDLSARQTQIIKALRLYCENDNQDGLFLFWILKKLSILFNITFYSKGFKTHLISESILFTRLKFYIKPNISIEK